MTTAGLLAFAPADIETGMHTVIHANPTDELLGWICWNDQWRQRVFRPRMGTLWSPPLLQVVASYIGDMPPYRYAQGGDK